MDAVGLLVQQFETVNIRMNHVSTGLDRSTLMSRVSPQANSVGFQLWHMARTQDWAIHTAIRGVPEVAHRPPWLCSPMMSVRGMGTGFGPTEVQCVEQDLDVQALRAYANDVHVEAVTWLRGLDETELDLVPDVTAHQAAHAEYQTPEFVADMSSGPEHDAAVAGGVDLPTWLLVTSVCLTHLHRHLGEIDLTLGVVMDRRG